MYVDFVECCYIVDVDVGVGGDDFVVDRLMSGGFVFLRELYCLYLEVDFLENCVLFFGLFMVGCEVFGVEVFEC